MVGLAGKDAVEGLEGAFAVALGGVDLGQRDRGQGGRGAGARWNRRAHAADALGGVREVQAALDDAREEVSRHAEEAPRALRGRVVGRAAEEQLVDELGTGEDARARDARGFGAQDEIFAIQPFELRAVHATVMGQPERRCKRGAKGGTDVHPLDRTRRASATSRAICALSSSRDENFFSSRRRAARSTRRRAP